MKRIALTFALCLFALVSATAQTINKNNKFWDGQYLYVAELQPKNIVALKGMDITGHQQDILLKKEKKAGEYTLLKNGDQAPFGCLWGSRVQYVRRNGMNFLAFYVEEHTIGQTIVLTPDNIVTCTEQERVAEEDSDPMSLLSSWIMNQHYLSRIVPDDLQYMADHLRNLPRRDFIEQTNLQLIGYALTWGLGADGREPGEENMDALAAGDALNDIITVSNEREFLAALGSNRTVRIADGTTLFLSNMLENEAFFSQAGRAWRNDYYAERSGSKQLIVSCERFDGRQLELVNVHNLTIKGGRDCHIIVSPRYANVLNLYSCRNVSIENLTIGHTEEGYCEGGVIYAEGSEALRITNCDLYGCGTYGLEAQGSSDIVMERTVIHDCSYGIMTVFGSQNLTFRDCDFVRCREFGLLEFGEDCYNVKFEGCRFAQNKGALFANLCPVTLSGCEVYHEGGVGSGYELLEYSGKDTTFDGNISQLPSRRIGPK
ncbi:MAG: right-handed parallel beta-helix repeat-containing protein [Alloprevotella sp.]|nr:right-handed parallel beta-helix repeat-containing protein [Alloprevotella sp.]